MRKNLVQSDECVHLGTVPKRAQAINNQSNLRQICMHLGRLPKCARSPPNGALLLHPGHSSHFWPERLMRPKSSPKDTPLWLPLQHAKAPPEPVSSPDNASAQLTAPPKEDTPLWLPEPDSSSDAVSGRCWPKPDSAFDAVSGPGYLPRRSMIRRSKPSDRARPAITSAKPATIAAFSGSPSSRTAQMTVMGACE